MFEVEFYQDKNGNEPIKEFIIELQSKGQTSKTDRIRVEKILTYIKVLQQYGTRAGEPYMKHINGDIWELRPQRDRIFFFFCIGHKFILLSHCFKTTQKTPKREIETAIRAMREYIERSGIDGK